MNKKIYAFIIPFVTLVIVGFTPVLDLIAHDFKDEINVQDTRGYWMIKKNEYTIKLLEDDFERTVENYKTYIHQHFGTDKNITIYLLNYFYYFNQRSIAMIRNHKANVQTDTFDDDVYVKNIMSYEELAEHEYRCASEIFGSTDLNILDEYKSKSEVNDLMASVTYSYIYDAMEAAKSQKDDNQTMPCRAVNKYKE